MFLFLTIIVGCVQTFQVNPSGPAISQPTSRLGFRFTALPECYLVTEVLPGYGAEQAGLQVGDCIESVDGVVGDAVVSALRDPTRSSVLLSVRPVLKGQSEQMSVRRGVYQASISQSNTHPLLTAASSGQLESMISMLDETVAYDVIEQATPLLARFYPQLFPMWLKSLQERFEQDSVVSGLLIRQYGQLQDWTSVLDIYQSHSFEVQQLWIRWAPSISKVVAKAHWETGAHHEAIQMVREMQPWTFETGLEQTVGLAPLEGTISIERQRLPSQPNLHFETLSGTNWDITTSPWSVVTFWATWCHPCQKELPELQEWAKMYPNVQVLAVNMNDNPSAKEVTKTFVDWGIQPIDNWQNSIDQSKAIDLEIVALPTLILLDSSGVEHKRVQGYLPDVSQHLDTAIRLNHSSERFARFRGSNTIQWFNVPDIQDLVRDGDTWWMLTDELHSGIQIETLLTSGGDAENLSGNLRQDRLIVSNGRVVTVDQKHSVLRLFEGSSGSWFRTLPSVFVDAVWWQDWLVVALSDRIVILSSEGDLLQTMNVSVQNLQVYQNRFKIVEVHMMIQGSLYRISLEDGVFGVTELKDGTVMPDSVTMTQSTNSGQWVRLQDGQMGWLILENQMTNQPSIIQSSEAFFEVFDAETDTMWVVFPKSGVLKMSASSQIP